MIKKLASSKNFVVLVISLAAVVAIFDQFTKLIAKQYLPLNQSIPVLGDLLRFRLTLNESAAFSIGFGATWIFAVISSLAALTGLYFAFKVRIKSWAAMLGISIGGVVGNLIDRLTQEPGFGNGRVVDFLQIPFNFPIFNVADIAISTIATLTVIRVLLGHPMGFNSENAK